MSFREKMPTSPKSPLRRRRSSWTGSWLNHPTTSFKEVVSAVIQAQSPRSTSKPQTSDFDFNFDFDSSKVDRTLSLPDSLLLRILQKLPDSQNNNNDVSLVCKRWLSLQGRRLRTLKLLDYDFLLSEKLVSRFPKLTSIDLSNACMNPNPNPNPNPPRILLCHKSTSCHVSSDSSNWEENLLPSEVIDRGLRVLGRGSCDLLKLVVINATELGLVSLAEHCSDLQELELHKCNDNLLRGIAACESLRVLRLVGSVEGLYTSSVSDIGLTILAQGCKRLVKLELSGCEGSFDGIKAIGQCCEVLEELTICDHRMDDGGWIAALSYFGSLKRLRVLSCGKLDPSPGPEKMMLRSCPALESLQLERCCLNDKEGMRALFKVCDGVRKVRIQDCWGLDDDSFSLAKAFRKVRFLSLEGCSVLTTGGLESVILHWEELESMRVVSCKNIKDSEISPALSSLFSLLKELTWRPDTRSHLSSKLEGAGIGKRGGKFFKKR